MSAKSITNFGRNLTFTAEVFEPHSEAEVLEILASCSGRKIRVAGRYHSWSEAIVTEDVLLDLRHMNAVGVEERDGRMWVTAAAGCQIKRLLAELDHHGLTMPAVGIISEQAIAGAISTGTHGSGNHCMSHFAEEVRIAAYDPTTGQPVVRVVSDGEELRAARCSLGALGVIVSVGFWARPRYQVEEFFEQYDRLEDVLALEAEHPLQQFFLIPWRWKYVCQHRRELDKPRSRSAGFYRWYFLVVMDLMLHISLLALAHVLRNSSCTKFFFRHLATGTVIPNWHVVDRAQDMLIMERELFRHVEIEVFVTRSQLSRSLLFIEALLKHFDGDRTALSETWGSPLNAAGLLSNLDQLCGSYTHQYMICVRRILPDDTLISMTSGGDEAWYSLSFVSYARQQDRQAFFLFADQLTKTMAALFNGRPHWGKYCPLTNDEAARLYPELPVYRRVCEQFDPRGVFRNPWLERTLFSPPEPSR